MDERRAVFSRSEIPRYAIVQRNITGTTRSTSNIQKY